MQMERLQLVQTRNQNYSARGFPEGYQIHYLLVISSCHW